MSSINNGLSHENRIGGLRKTYFSDKLGDPIIGNVSVVRAKIATEAYKEFAGDDVQILRAKTLDKVLTEMPLYILDGDLIAGQCVSAPRAAELYPEFGVDWLTDEIDRFDTREADKYHVREEDKPVIREMISWWTGKTVNDRVQTALGPDKYSLAYRGLIFMGTPAHFSGSDCIAVDYETTLFKYGINGYISQIEEKLSGLDPVDPQSPSKRIFYEACLIALKAVLKFAKRYADLARELAEKEEDPGRKAELLQIAANCEHVPANPPRNLWEALQAVNLLHHAYCYDSAAFIYIPGRMDQFLYPFYKKDLEDGRLTKEEAQTLLECQLLKYSDSRILWDFQSALFYSGNPTIHVVTIGGVTPDGKDASNDVSYMIIDAYKHLKMQEPELTCVIHKDTPDEFLHAVSEFIKVGIAHPKIGVLETMKLTHSKEGYDYPEEQLNNLAWAGCGESCFPSYDRHGPDYCYTTGPMASVELALNDGKLRLNGDQIGLPTGDPRKFATFDDFMEAFKAQHEYAIRTCVEFRHAIQYSCGELVPTPMQSVFTFDCLETGLDRLRGGARYNGSSGSDFGMPSSADAIAALKKVVFEDNKYTLAEVVDALDANFDGYEKMRQDLLAAPKYGNDEEYVDSIAHDIGVFMNTTFRSYPEFHGGFQKDTYAAVTGGIAVGRMLGATPDGRLASTALNDGGVSPHMGRDFNGPTAVMKSASKIDWSTCGGGVLNLKFSKDAVAGEEGTQNLMALLRSYVKMGGYHVQFNIIDKATLLDAQAHPEDYSDMLVRVAAYSAYYVQLPKVLQDNIIERTSHVM